MSEVLFHWIERVRIMQDRRRAIETLSALSDHHLADIGIERGDIDTYVRLGYPWPVLSSEARYNVQASLQGCG